MSDPFKLRIESEADLSGFEQFDAAYKKALEDVKGNLAAVLGGEGASPEFIAQMTKGIDELTAKLDGAGKGDFAALNAEIEQLVQNLHAAAEAEGVRIQRAKQAAAVAAQNAKEQADEATRLRAVAQQRQLDVELEELAFRKRMAHAAQEIEMQRALAQAAQMRREQQITSEVMSKGAYSPAEDVAAWKARESAVKATGQAAVSTGANAGLAALQLAQFVDDAQYGLRGIMNNIPGLILAMGGSAGIAGVASIAAVAVFKLWEAFSGSKKAEQDAAALKERMGEVSEAAAEAAQASADVFEQDMGDYLSSLGEVASLWEKSKTQIQEALGYSNEMAKAQQQITEAAIEIERTKELGKAGSKEERDAINASYDMRISQVRREGEEAARQRAIEAQQTAANTAAARAKDVQAAADAAKGAGAANDQGIQDIVNSGAGRQSDQVRRANERALIEADNARLADKERNRGARPVDLPGVAGLFQTKKQMAYDAEIQADIERGRKNSERMRELEVSRAADEAAMRGQGPMTFEGAKSDAKAKGDASSLAAIEAAEKALEARLKERAEIAAKALELEKAAFEAQLQAKTEKDKLALVEQQNKAAAVSSAAKEAKDAEEREFKAKQAADAKAKKEADDKRQEEIRRAENDARESRLKGDESGAAKAEARARELRLGDDATPEEKRRMQLEAASADRERARQKIERETTAQGNATAAQGDAAVRMLGNDGLGAAAKDLQTATSRLRDGATESEAAQVAAALRELVPMIGQMSQQTRQEMSRLLAEVNTLKSQLRNTR